MRAIQSTVGLTCLLCLGLATLTLSADASSPTSQRHEGQAGSAGRGRLAEWGEANPSAVSALSVLYRFSGVSDDGEQGSASRREATSVHCTNVSATTTEVEVQFFQWNGTDVYTGTVNMPTNRTFTFSTQNTTIYFDDVLLGGSPGTDAIFQGSGRVLASNSNVICTAQVLDPLNYPPTFVVKLDLFDRDGNLIGDVHRIYLPLIRKS